MDNADRTSRIEEMNRRAAEMLAAGSKAMRVEIVAAEHQRLVANATETPRQRALTESLGLSVIADLCGSVIAEELGAPMPRNQSETARLLVAHVLRTTASQTPATEMLAAMHSEIAEGLARVLAVVVSFGLMAQERAARVGHQVADGLPEPRAHTLAETDRGEGTGLAAERIDTPAARNGSHR